MDKITIERETLEDALEEAEDLFQAFGYVGATPKCSALRAALAAQPAEAQQEPVAWVIPGNDNASAKGFIDAMAWQEGEFSRPLYAAPPAPAAVPSGYELVPIKQPARN